MTIAEALLHCQMFLPEGFVNSHQRLFHPENIERLAKRLEKFHQGETLELPAPTLTVECTPSLTQAFSPWSLFLSQWYESEISHRESLLSELASLLSSTKCQNILVLMGQRFTPASLTDERGILPPTEILMESASRIHSSNLSVAARALSKHVNRVSGDFWGDIRGNDEQKNKTADEIVRGILEKATWHNVFGHYKHEIVYEARVEEGYGVRWGQDGQEFIGFLEPFTEGFPEVR